MVAKITKTKAEEDYAGHFARFSGAFPGGSEVKAMRQKAMERFVELGLPHRRVESWKYTDLRSFLKDAYTPALQDSVEYAQEDLTKALGAFAQMEAYRIVFINGILRQGDPEIEVRSLGKALVSDATLLGKLGQSVDLTEENAAIVLNAAFMTDGALIKLKTSLPKPLHLVFVTTGEQPQSVAIRNMIEVADGVKATLIEHHITLGKTAFQSNVLSEMIVGVQAEVQHIKVQNETSDSVHLSTALVRIGASARYDALHLSLGAALSRNQVFAQFAGSHAHAQINGVFLGRGKQHCDTTLLVDHAVPHCSSKETYKVVLADQARGVFQGKLLVRPDAQKTDAKQMAQALLLSEDAEFDAKPELEIFADDVVCGHGATSGQIDDDLLFYLRARGISETEARGLLIAAFIGEVLEQVEDETIRAALTAEVERWLASLK